MNIKVVKQSDSLACGPTCIKMVTDYIGYNIPLAKIKTVSKYKQRQGLSNDDLVGTVTKLGLSVKVKKQASWNDLIRYTTKDSVIIVSWILKGYIGHFSVVEKVSRTHIYLADPAVGKIISLPKVMFLRLWFDYDDLWYPIKNSDIQLRWLAIISKNKKA